MKVFITIPQGIYDDTTFTVAEFHRGYCRVLDTIDLLTEHHILCDFDIPDEETAIRRWISPFYEHFTNKWRTLHKETVWCYNANMAQWIKLKQSHSN